MSTPRILAEHLDSFVGRTVIIVGKVLQLRGNYAVIDAEGQVTINLTPVSTLHGFLCHPSCCATDLFPDRPRFIHYPVT